MNDSSCARIYVIEDDPLQAAIHQHGLAEVASEVAHFGSAESFLVGYQPASAECLLLDLQLPAMNGLELLHEIKRRHWQVTTVAMSATATPDLVVDVLHAGAYDFLAKPVELQALRAKVQQALAKDGAVKQRARARVEGLARLSQREQEVLDLLLEAATTVQIAHRLEISPKTVDKHRLSIFNKLGVDSVPGVMRLLLPAE